MCRISITCHLAIICHLYIYISITCLCLSTYPTTHPSAVCLINYLPLLYWPACTYPSPTSVVLLLARPTVLFCHCDERADRSALKMDLVWLAVLVYPSWWERHSSYGTGPVAVVVLGALAILVYLHEAESSDRNWKWIPPHRVSTVPQKMVADGGDLIRCLFLIITASHPLGGCKEPYSPGCCSHFMALFCLVCDWIINTSLTLPVPCPAGRESSCLFLYCINLHTWIYIYIVFMSTYTCSMYCNSESSLWTDGI